MSVHIGRRGFIEACGIAASAAVLSSFETAPAHSRTAIPANRMKKAVGWEMILEDIPLEDKFRITKDAGFDGVEVNSRLLKAGSPAPEDLARASEKTGVPIHGVSGASNPDLKSIIEEAAILGADTVLHVVRTDPNGSYMEKYRTSQQAIREAIPYAEQKRVKILVENVWATFLIEPLSMARYIDEIGSPWVQSYFDVGNVMRWGVPQHWIEVLGKRIVKAHVKEFSLKTAMSQGMSKGFDFPMGGGDIQWNRVREEFEKIQFRGWVTAEVRGGDRERLAEISAEMTKILAL